MELSCKDKMVKLTIDEAKEIEQALSKLYRNTECGWVNSYRINEGELRRKLNYLSDLIEQVEKR